MEVLDLGYKFQDIQEVPTSLAEQKLKLIMMETTPVFALSETAPAEALCLLGEELKSFQQNLLIQSPTLEIQQRFCRTPNLLWSLMRMMVEVKLLFGAGRQGCHLVPKEFLRYLAEAGLQVD